MSLLKSRLKRLESGQKGCPECYHKPQVFHSFYPGKGEEAPIPPACPSCGRSFGAVIRVVYEGEGV
jgi:hypothetical protein